MRRFLGVLLSKLEKALERPLSRSCIAGLATFLRARNGELGGLNIIFKKSGWHHFAISHLFRFHGDYVSAATAMIKACEANAENHLFCVNLAKIYEENSDYSKAQSYLKVAAKLKPSRGLAKLLYLETRYAMHQDGSKTFERILDLPADKLFSSIAILNSSAIYYPEHYVKWTAARKKLADFISGAPSTNSYDFSQRLNSAITMADLRLATKLRRKESYKLLPQIEARFSRLMNHFGEHLEMLDAAWENEISSQLLATFNGKVLPLSELTDGRRKVVELFIPTAIFDYPRREKKTHETVREVFFHIIGSLLKAPDLVIVPRMQLNWRNAIPKTTGSYVISYHTISSPSHLRLHVQESPLSGYCSFDQAGFAGFASTAEGHDQIADFTLNISDEALAENQRELYEKLVTRNVSKYAQRASVDELPEKYIFVALQVSADVVAQLAWFSAIEMLETLIDFYGKTRTKIVVKSHPFCRSTQMQTALDAMESVGSIIRTHNSIHTIIRGADAVFTVNSGVGLESLIHGKVVVVVGACDYTYGAKVAKTREELKTILSGDLAPDKRKIQELLYFYVNRFAILSNDAEKVAARLEEWLNP